MLTHDLAGVFAGYFSDPAWTGLPAADRLPRVAMADDAEKRRPLLEFRAEEEDEPMAGHYQARKMKLVIELRAALRKEDESAEGAEAGRMTRAEAGEHLAAARARLLDTEALRAWLAGLPLERRTGWQLQRPPRPLAEEAELDGEARTLDLRLTARLTVLVAA